MPKEEPLTCDILRCRIGGFIKYSEEVFASVANQIGDSGAGNWKND